MDSGNNSSSLQSSSGGGGDNNDDFDSQNFFTPTTNMNSSSFSINNNRNNSSNINHHHNISINNLHQPHLSFFDYLDNPSSSSFPLLSSTTHNHNPPTPIPTPTPTPTPRASKKRSRASRRAPTTVLTTDTSNFRAMVQEFTGVPSPPFSSSSSSRFLSTSPLLKPYPHKYQFPNNFHASTTPPTAFNYQLPSTSSNPIHSFQSLLQSQLTNNNNAANLGAMTTQPMTNPLMMPSMTASNAAAGYGMPGSIIGSGWGQDAAGDPTHLRQVNNGCNAEKGGEARGEGMVESWICSSD